MPESPAADVGISINDLFYRAASMCDFVTLSGTRLDPDRTEDCRLSWNALVDTWRADGTTINHLARVLFPITPGQGDYTIGPDGDWDTDRPARMERMGVVLTSSSSGGPPYPEIPLFQLTIDQWQNWVYKDQVTTYSRHYFYELDFPLGIVHLLYVPSEGDSIALYLERILSKIAAVGDEMLLFPPGYEEALTTNLAVRLASMGKGAKLSKETARMAVTGLQLIRDGNNRPLIRSTDLSPGWNGRSNIYLGNRYRP